MTGTARGYTSLRSTERRSLPRCVVDPDCLESQTLHGQDCGTRTTAPREA